MILTIFGFLQLCAKEFNIFITRSNKDDCLQIIHPKHNYVQSSASYPRGLLQAFQSGKLLDKCLEKKSSNHRSPESHSENKQQQSTVSTH